ncbi:MAG: hypothetical protein RR413_11645, partial [Christensenellaceae bacterium]
EAARGGGARGAAGDCRGITSLSLICRGNLLLMTIIGDGYLINAKSIYRDVFKFFAFCLMANDMERFNQLTIVSFTEITEMFWN